MSSTSARPSSWHKNTYCIFCMECLRTCPHDNVAVNVRWFGGDLVKPTPVRFDEAAMVVVMLGMSTFHGVTMTPAWVTVVAWIQSVFGIGYLSAFSLGMAGFLTVLLALYVVFIALA